MAYGLDSVFAPETLAVAFGNGYTAHRLGKRLVLVLRGVDG